MVLMGWGGADGAYAVSGIFLFVGPVLLILGTIFEWIMGKCVHVSLLSELSATVLTQYSFFPMMVMSLFSVFWLSFGLLQLPTLQLAGAYAPAGTGESLFPDTTSNHPATPN